MSFSKVIVMGNLGSDPEMRYMPDGKAVTNFSLATNRRWNDTATGETREEATWFRVTVWGRQAESVNQYLMKGRQCLVEGRIKPDPQTGGPRLYTRQDGSVGASFEITATSVTFIGGRGDSNGQEDGAYRDGNGRPQEEDEIPF